MSPRRGLVLVAEDSLVVRALLRAQLRDRGYEIVEAADGEQALVLAGEVTPDVILLDIDMPKLDGFQVLERLKADPQLAEVPVVFITGRTTADDAVHGLELGAHDYLRKPFEAAELAARIHAAMRTHRLQDELRALNQELARQAATDELTGLPNRRFLDEELERLCSRCARHGRTLAVLLLDIDSFKRINDEHGHQTGDQVLAQIVRRLAERLRAEDLLGRWGGEEFLILAPDIDEAGAAVLADALVSHLAARPIEIPAGQVPVTASIGWATWNDDLPEDIVRRADAALDAAKRGGRNQARGEGSIPA